MQPLKFRNIYVISIRILLAICSFIHVGIKVDILVKGALRVYIERSAPYIVLNWS